MNNHVTRTCIEFVLRKQRDAFTGKAIRRWRDINLRLTGPALPKVALIELLNMAR